MMDKRKISLIEAICKETDEAKLAMIERVLSSANQDSQTIAVDEEPDLTSDDLIFGEQQLSTLKAYQQGDKKSSTDYNIPEEGINPFDELLNPEE